MEPGTTGTVTVNGLPGPPLVVLAHTAKVVYWPGARPVVSSWAVKPPLALETNSVGLIGDPPWVRKTRPSRVLVPSWGQPGR